MSILVILLALKFLFEDFVKNRHFFQVANQQKKE